MQRRRDRLVLGVAVGDESVVTGHMASSEFCPSKRTNDATIEYQVQIHKLHVTLASRHILKALSDKSDLFGCPEMASTTLVCQFAMVRIKKAFHVIDLDQHGDCAAAKVVANL